MATPPKLWPAETQERVTAVTKKEKSFGCCQLNIEE